MRDVGDDSAESGWREGDSGAVRCTTDTLNHLASLPKIWTSLCVGRSNADVCIISPVMLLMVWLSWTISNAPLVCSHVRMTHKVLSTCVATPLRTHIALICPWRFLSTPWPFTLRTYPSPCTPAIPDRLDQPDLDRGTGNLMEVFLSLLSRLPVVLSTWISLTLPL